jgi:hypothetical protein
VMSQMGHLPTFGKSKRMSALPGSGHQRRAPSCLLRAKNRLMLCSKSKKELFEHLVGAGKQRGRHDDAERVGGLHVDH